jgi:hypothetical protein
METYGMNASFEFGDVMWARLWAMRSNRDWYTDPFMRIDKDEGHDGDHDPNYGEPEVFEGEE